MNATLPLLVLALALPASAQIFDSAVTVEGLAEGADCAHALREKFAPVDVDSEPVQLLARRLAKDGEQIEMEQRIGNIYVRIGKPDERGRLRKLQANLIEIPAETMEAPSDGLLLRAVMHRYFSHLEATSESWAVDSQTGRGTLHIWRYQVSLQGKLMSVEHIIAPLAPGPDGQVAPIEADVRSYRLAPSHTSAQLRWKALAKEMLSMGRLVEA
ncbi:MAG: hypothetical protein AAB268_00340 [Elusimicrobiota bacterium]